MGKAGGRLSVDPTALRIAATTLQPMPESIAGITAQAKAHTDALLDAFHQAGFGHGAASAQAHWNHASHALVDAVTQLGEELRRGAEDFAQGDVVVARAFHH